MDPIVRFMGLLLPNGKIGWRFIKYDAPDNRFPRRDSKVPVSRPAVISTTRVAHLTCRECGWTGIYPAWGKPESVPCPACPSRGCEVEYIKEGGSEFFSLMGDLKQKIEDCLHSADPSGAGLPEFSCPDVVAVGNVDPDPDVPDEYHRYSQDVGWTVRSLRHMTAKDLLGGAIDYDGAGLQLLPGLTMGVLDADEAREGWSRSEGVLTQRVKLPWLPKIRRACPSFHGCRI